MSQFVNLEEVMVHNNGTNTEVSGHIQRDTPDSDVEVQGISSSSSRETTRPFYNNIIAGKALLHGKKILSKVWPLVNIFPFIWCANRISIDPFFLYAYVINYDKKCIEEDKKLTAVDRHIMPYDYVIIMGSFVSLARAGLLKTWLQRTVWFLLFLIDFLTYLPFRETLALTNTIWPESWPESELSVSNFYSANLFLLQYYITVILVYIIFTRATRTWATLAKVTWGKVVFNLLLYIHGGHVFGGLWYAFAIQKEMECWMKACKQHDQCRPNNFTCNGNSRDNKFINQFCPTKPPNANVYDFGIYHEALESGIVEMWNLPKRVLHCFRWGLQNLSGFGQNLKASTDAWENIFVISMIIYGMVLFVFFIGNMQMYLKSETERSEMIRQKKQQIEQSKSFAILSKDLQKQIKRYQPDIWEETKGVEFEYLFNLHEDLRKNIKRQLCLVLLKNVDEFRSWSEQLLDELCDCAKPVSYAQHVEIVRKGSSIDEMLFLVQGKLQTYSLTSVDTGSAAIPPRFEISINHLEEGKFCGEELVAWFQADLYSSNLPISTRTIQTITKVDAFALMSYDLQNVFIKHRTAHSTSTQMQAPPPADSQPQVPPPPAEPPAQQPASGI